MTQWLHHSDLILVFSCNHNLQSAGGHSLPPSLIIWVKPFLIIFFPSDQLISAVQWDQTGWNLLEVWIWKSPSIEEYGNKTFTWTEQGSWSPQARGKRQGNLIRHNTFFLHSCPITMSSLRNSSSQVLEKRATTRRNKDIPLTLVELKQALLRKAANFPPWDEIKVLKPAIF